MKSKFALIFVAFALFAINASQYALADNNPCNPSITLVNFDPNPAVPAEYVKALFQVSGVENPNCNGMKLWLEPEYPFSLDPNASSIQSIEGSTFIKDYNTVWMVPYKLRVADDALEGGYNLKVHYIIGAGSDFNSSASKDFAISVSDSQTSFDTVLQDVSGTQASIGIVNTGKNTANSLVASIPSQDNFRASGTSGQIVGNLQAGDYTIVSFSITPKNSRNMSNGGGAGGFQANNEDRTLKVQIDYTDGIGKRRSVIKEMPYNFNSAQGSNFTLRNLAGSNRTGMSGTSSPISIWWYIAGGAVILIILFKLWKHGKILRKNNGKDNDDAPDWVANERTRKKK